MTSRGATHRLRSVGHTSKTGSNRKEDPKSCSGSEEMRAQKAEASGAEDSPSRLNVFGELPLDIVFEVTITSHNTFIHFLMNVPTADTVIIGAIGSGKSCTNG